MANTYGKRTYGRRIYFIKLYKGLNATYDAGRLEKTKNKTNIKLYNKIIHNLSKT